MTKKVINVLKIIIPLGIGLYLIWYFYDLLSDNEKEQLYHAFSRANYWWIVPSIFVGLLSHLSRAYRWKYLLEPMGYKPPFKSAYNALMIGYIVNIILPRAGEVSRAAILNRTDKVPFEKSFGTIVMERIVDVLMLGIIFLITLASQYNQIDIIQDRIKMLQDKNGGESSSGTGTYILISIAVVFVIGVVFVFRSKKIQYKIKKLISGGWEGFRSILKSNNKGPFLLHTCIIWVLYVLMFALCFQALPETSSMPFAGIMAGFIAGTIGLIFVQGGIGVYPALVGIIITIYIYPEYSESPVHPIGMALGWIIWSSQTFLMIILGLISIVLTPAKKIIHESDTEGQ